MPTPFEYLLKYAKDTPDKQAIVVAGSQLTFKDFFIHTEMTADFFKSRGVVSGSKIAVYTDDALVLLENMFAAWAIGACCVPVNITQGADGINKLESIVVPDIGFTSLDNISGSRNFPLHKYSPNPGPLKYALTLDSINNSIPAVIMSTSGSSGVPKAVPWTHQGLWHNTWFTAERLGITADDKLFINTPPYTASSIIHILTMMSKGASTVIDRGVFFGSGILDKIMEFNCTGFGGVPALFIRLLSEGGLKRSGDLRFFMNSGDHLPVSIIQQLSEQFPEVKIFCAYGLTEITGRFTILEPELIQSKAGSVGRPLKDLSFSVRDENLCELPYDTDGEIFINGPCLMSGYINNPDLNSKLMTSYGFATGDIGYTDKDGYLFLKGRSDDVFKVGGEKVSSKLTEDAIYGFGVFREIAIIPKYDEHFGNVTCLYYVLKDGMDFSPAKLKKYLKGKIPDTHFPVKCIQINTIPKTSSGKLIRNAKYFK